MESGWLTTAAKTHEFETRFAEAVNAKFACAVNSCTAALHLAAEAIGISSGDKVFVPTWTFTASAEILRYLGADPVFLDVEEGSCLITPAILETAIAAHPSVKAVVIVHFAGQSAQMVPLNGQPGILDICLQHGIRIIEDAAHAFPSCDQGTPVGGFGDVTCFSFYANKTITTGEGGILTTNDEKLYKRCKIMRLHGIDRDIWKRFTGTGESWEYDVIAPGFKYNMPDINAAVGLAQLERAEEFRLGRQRCVEQYIKRLQCHPALDLPKVRVALKDHSWHLFPLVVKDKPGLPSRNTIIERLAFRGIGTSVHYKPLHRMTYYRERYNLQPASFPVAEKMWKGCFSLPVYPSLSTDQLQYITNSLEEILSL